MVQEKSVRQPSSSFSEVDESDAAFSAIPDARQQRWIGFAAEFPDDPRLQPDTMYALPSQLIDFLENRSHGLLTADDIRFERSLRYYGGTGFHNQRAFVSEVLDPPELKELSLDLYGDFFQQMKRQGAMLMHGAIPEKSDITKKRLQDKRKELQMRFAQRLQGYAGWLVTNPEFRREATALSDRWKPCRELGPIMPELSNEPFPATHNGEELKRYSQLFQSANDFLRKWNLVRMATWDLPVPISPIQLTDDPIPIPTNALTSMGVSIFIPWTLLADRDLKIEDVVAYHRERQDLSHLDGWIRDKKAKLWGVTRNAKMLQLYVYLELAIKQRYQHRIRGKLGMLDEVFSAWWATSANVAAILAGVESVKRDRQELQRRVSRLKGSVE